MLQTQVRIYDSKNCLKKTWGNVSSQNDCLSQYVRKKLFDKATSKYPILIFDEENIIYALIVSKEKSKIIIGPVYIDSYTKNIEKYYVEHYKMPNGVRISKYDMSIFCEEVLLLYNLLYSKNMTYVELIKKNFGKSDISKIIKKEITDTKIHHDNNYLHNPHDREVRILESIKNGDTKRLELSLNEVFIGKYGVLARDKLRSAKNLAICHIVLSSRAAVAGGVPSEMAFSVCDYFVLKIEDAMRIDTVEILERESHFYYAELVYKHKNSFLPKDKNPVIDQCKNIIFKNINKKIMVKDIARSLNINPDYLSKIFHEEEHITIHDYIIKEKISLAENLLIYSDYTFQQIAFQFGFCSQSHFSKVFKKQKGITPQNYRKKHGAQNRFYSDNDT